MDHPEENRFPAAADRYVQSASFEARLVSLAERGFSIELRVAIELYGKNVGQVRFSIELRKGGRYGESSMTATGSGLSLDDASRAALRSAESFLQDPEPPTAVEGALSDLACPVPAITAGERI